MFSQVSVMLFPGGGGVSQTTTAAYDTHPTGMHSCSSYILVYLYVSKWEIRCQFLAKRITFHVTDFIGLFNFEWYDQKKWQYYYSLVVERL